MALAHSYLLSRLFTFLLLLQMGWSLAPMYEYEDMDLYDRFLPE